MTKFIGKMVYQAERMLKWSQFVSLNYFKNLSLKLIQIKILETKYWTVLHLMSEQ